MTMSPIQAYIFLEIEVKFYTCSWNLEKCYFFLLHSLEIQKHGLKWFLLFSTFAKNDSGLDFGCFERFRGCGVHPTRLILPFRTNLHEALELAFEYAVTPPFLKKSIVLHINLICNTILLLEIYYRFKMWLFRALCG